MRIIRSFVLPLLSVCILAAATPLSRRAFQLKHELSACPDQWTRVATPPSGHLLDLRIGLKQSRVDELIDQLYQISDPDHEQYGNYLSTDNIRSFVEPSEDSMILVLSWLAEHGLSAEDVSFSPTRDWMHVTVSIDVIQRMLGAEYHLYQHDNGLDQAIRTLSYSLPEYLHDHIDVIHPTTYFTTARPQPVKSMDTHTRQRRSAIALAADTTGVQTNSVEEFRKFYKTINYVPKATGMNKLAVLGFLDEVAIRTDLQLYLADERPDAVGADFREILINGGVNSQVLNNSQIKAGKGQEGNLDIQTAFGVAYPTPIDFISIGGSPPFTPDASTPENTNEPYLQLVDYLLSLSDDKLPRTVSISYADPEQTVPYDYAKRVCDGFAQIGARGVSVLFASGDSGVGPDGADADECQTNDGQNTRTFLPNFPSSCPYVTTVGATQGFSPEIAQTNSDYSDYYSGGGFSKYFSRPAYQDSAVAQYLQGLGSQNSGLYNPAGRGYPDVAAQGLYFKVYWNGSPKPISGTSAATPLFASIVALLNDHLLSENKQPLGFMNPFLYKKGFQGLNDIVQGSSKGCNTNGFTAAPGWDAVTGLGTPDFEKLLQLVDSP